MLRDFKFMRGSNRKGNDDEEIENVPINPNESNSTRVDQEISGKSKFVRTPTKPKGKNSDNAALPLRTPERHLSAANVGKNKFGFSSLNEGCGEGRSEMASYISQSSRYGSSLNLTPRINGGGVRGGATSSLHSESTSTQSTPTKSVSKPPNPGFAPFSSSRHHGSARGGNYGALSRRFSVSSCPPCIVNTVEVPHFDLKEDPSFWMYHNVQVILRVRPLNSFEINMNGYNRCVKQDSAQCITWVGQPETRFTFDHVACETVDQEMLFRMAGRPMVENCLSGYNSCMFAYGQTGSGKTFTMLGEMEDLEFKPSPHRGMTPRMFEFLFARIRAEEESRRDEKLKYSCKCSFLEIYNEQITDLLDPSSSNLLLREDVKKGVYVENLSEFEVHTVGDVVRLLVQGSSNRKVAATNMNRESSRSHSVFTCIIESKWEGDSTTNLRFARLNLVDLAGSERQKSSGAEGERLKEAANINKSLSTLGHVIMLLVDIAHGKPRHVPYRDSRLTFLLQDSLGGNSKTMIIANISPSISCAAETLNTLKFAQRAKLIQNNAVVNEDSTGDVAVLQRQISLLQEELSALRHQSVSRTLAFDHPSTATCQENIDTESKPQSDELTTDKLGEPDSEGSLRVSHKQLKAVESMLAGALRREQIADTSIRQLEAEIEQLNRLVRQREEDTRCTKMMLKFREDKIQRMESLLGDLKPVDSYLAEENAALVEEVQMLQAKVDKNPEVTRFALENIRLLGQLRKFQDFYEESERDILMNEVSELRAQLIRALEHSNQQTSQQHSAPDEHSNIEENQSLRSELMNTMNELDECRSKLKSCLDSNAKLNREIDELQALMRDKELEICIHQNVVHQMKEVVCPCVGAQAIDAAQEERCKINQENLVSHAEEIVNLELELDILRIILKEEKLSHKRTQEMAASLTRDVQLANDEVLLISKQFEEARGDMQEAKAVIEALESQQLLSINEIEALKNVNSHYQKLLRRKEHEISVLKEQTRGQEYAYSCLNHSECEDSALQTQLKRMQASLDKAKRLNMSFQTDHVSQKSNEEEMDEIRRQAEAETAEVIVSLQEELCMLQQQVHESELREKEMENKQKELQEAIDMMSQDNEALHRNLLEKNSDWEQLSCEIEEILVEGCDALGSASDQLDCISSAFSSRKGWISQQFDKLMRLISEKELIIAELNQCLEDANCRTNDLEHMLLSLRGATMVVTESHQQQCFEKEQEILLLRSELSRKASDIAELDDRMKLGHDQLSRISDCATAAFLVVSRLSEINSVLDTQVRQLRERDEEKDGFLQDQASALQKAQAQIDSLGKELEISESNCTRLTCQLNEQQRHISIMQRKLEENDEKAIENTKEILNDLKTGVSGLRSSMNQYVEEVGHTERHSPRNLGVDHLSVEQNGGQNNEINKAASYSAEGFEAGVSNTAPNTHFRGQKDLSMSSCNNSDSLKSCCRNGVNNSTIILLRKELESATESLKEVQAEMVHLSSEKEEIRISEKKCREGIEIVKAVLLNLEVAFSDFEKQCETKISALSHKLQKAEEYAEEARSSWWKTRESLEFELVNVEATAAQKEVEASCLLARFEEVQDTIQEADIMINGLMIANENLKLEVEDLNRRNAILKSERDDLSEKVQDLQYANELKDTQCKNLEEQYESSISEMMNHVEELEKLVLFVQDTSEGNFAYLANGFKCIKSQLHDAVKLMHSSLEEIWSEIVIKDCALSVLHLCHTGLLLETVTGLNAENGLLHHGICESNVMICNLREHNMKSKEELEMCRVLKGKLLADIKNSFDRISNKEGATTDLNMKLISFKEKLEALQHQEELMFERSNIMGSELALLMKELDQSNLTVMASLAEQEELLKSKEEVIESQAEDFMVQLFAKDFVALILAFELQQLALQRNDLERENVTCSLVLDSLLKDIVTLTITVELKEQLLRDRETDVLGLQSKVEEAKDREDRTRTELQTIKAEYQTSAEYLGLKKKEEELLHNELYELKSHNSTLLNDLQTKETQHNSSLGYIDELKSKIASLQNNLETKTAEIDDIICSRMSTDEELCNKSQELESYVIKVSEMEKEILILRDQLHSLKQRDAKALEMSSSKVANCVSSVETAEQKSNWMLKHLDENIVTVLDHVSEDACLNLDLLSNFLKELEFLDSTAKDLVSKNESLQEELFRKDEVLNGLLFDLHLLQESSANNKDQKDVIDELTASLESAEHELEIRSHEYDEVIAYNVTLEAKLKELEDVISELEADLGKANHSVNILSDENVVLRSRIENIMEEKLSVDRELSDTRCVVDRLENELLEMGNTLGHMNELAESLKSNLDEVSNERDNLQNELLISKEKVETAYALAEENEAMAAEAQEIAESRRIYAEEKEEEVKLLESSVLELDSTISVLENKVQLLNGEAERQRLQREELELELQTLKNQMHNIESTNADIKRHLDEKAINLQEALKRIKLLEKELTNKDIEIAQCKTHISELTVHAEAQACEYKNKFKELEMMVGQVKAEGASSHDKISSSNKLEKNGSKGRGSASPFKVKGSGSPFKARGSGSPFKCIGLGLAHQFKSEKDEEVTAERQRIEELEALAASRQKEIFMLNTRLAAAESMTHDVIRDLLGVKLDMSNYVKLLDKQQVQKMIDKARLDGVEPQNEEVKHLKQQLNEFVEERRGWLEEIGRRQAELVAAQDALEKHRWEQQMLIAENDVLKKRVTELEGEVKKLSGQQNLHQRIHHHAKIKEENNVLKTQNEDLTFRLQMTESYLSRINEELSHYRARRGRDPCINFDLEQRLTNKLKEVEEEKVHLAHTLLGLCTSILKAAGITRPTSEIDVSEAEEALEKLSSRVVSLEREVDDLNLKNKITNERIRLAELMPPDSSPFSTQSEDNRQMPRRAAQTPFFSALDR